MTNSLTRPILIIFAFMAASPVLSANETVTSQNFQVTGATKIITTQETQKQSTNISQQSKTTAYSGKNFRVERGNNVALSLENNMGAEEMSRFIQQKLAVTQVDPALVQKMKVFEEKLDGGISQYMQQNNHHSVKKQGNIEIERQVLFRKDGRDIFYDPKFMSMVWQKAEFQIQRYEFSPNERAFELLDEEFLKDDMLDLVSVIQKSTWFVFKHSMFMPFWIETLRIITDADFLAACSKEELVYLHYYIKKLFRVFSKALLGSKVHTKYVEYLLIFSAITPKLLEYEAAIGLVLQHFNPETKGEETIHDARALIVNQQKILACLESLKSMNYLEKIDSALNEEMAQIRAAMDKMNSGLQLSTGDIQVTTIIKTKVIDIQKRLLKRIRLILSGVMLKKFENTSIHSQLTGVLSSLEALLNSHMLDNDEEVEEILNSLELFLVKLEEYLANVQTQTDKIVVNENVHSQLLSSLMFFVSKVRGVKSIKTAQLKTQYALFLSRVQLLLLALEQPASEDTVELEFSKIPFVPAYDPNANFGDLISGYDTLPSDKVPEFENIKNGTEKTLYWIANNVDYEMPEIQPQVKRVFENFVTKLQTLVAKGTLLAPFYKRVLEVFELTAGNFDRLGTLEYVKMLQNLYLYTVSIEQDEKNLIFKIPALNSNSNLQEAENQLEAVQYSYRLYRENVRPLLEEILVHLKYVCSNCNAETLAGISNETTSFKGSILDGVNPGKRVKIGGGQDLLPSRYRVYIIEDLDCDIATVYLRFFKKEDSKPKYRMIL